MELPLSLIVSVSAGALGAAAVVCWTVMRVRGSEPKTMLVAAVVAAASGLVGTVAVSMASAWSVLAAALIVLVGAMMAACMPPMRHEVGLAADGSLYRYTDEDRTIINEACLRRWRPGVLVAALLMVVAVGALVADGSSLVVAAGALGALFAVGHGLTVLAFEARLKLAELRATRTSERLAHPVTIPSGH